MICIGIAVDHGGYKLKTVLMDFLKNGGYEVLDYGAQTFSEEDDYPDFVVPLAKAVSSGDVFRGVAICGSGVGACIVANKIVGERAALITDSFSAHQGIEDDDMNIGDRPRQPWALTFSFSRALQQPVLDLWKGDEKNVLAAQKALLHRAKCNWAACRGEYSSSMEAELV